MTRPDGERPDPAARTESTGQPQAPQPESADGGGIGSFVAQSPTDARSWGAPSFDAASGEYQPPAGWPMATPPDPADPTGTQTFAALPHGPQASPDQSPMWGAPPVVPAPDGRPPSRWKTWQKVTAGSVLAAVIGIGGVAAVSAANASSDSGTAQAAAGQVGLGGPGSGGGDGSGGGMRGGMAGAQQLFNALHGDFVVATDSGTQTMRLQTGEITALSDGSLTVQSADGYTSSFTVGSGVDVSGFAQGDTVRVIGTVSGDTATATSVSSGTTGFGSGGQGGQGGAGGQSGRDGMQPPEGMTPPGDGEQAPPTT